MFSYYGSKSKIVDYYPPPKYGKIIEPFAGSARYSLKYWDRDVLLVDKWPVVISIWKWLQQATVGDIKNLPKLKLNDDVRDFKLSEPETWLLRFMAQSGTVAVGYKVTEMGVKNLVTGYSNLMKSVPKIKHWEIKCMDYSEIDNTEATWFIDTPYQYGGHKYKFSNSNLNFKELGEWCSDRIGQVIVCENTKADWLPFKPMKQIQGGANTNTVEAIWSNHVTNYDHVQQSLF